MVFMKDTQTLLAISFQLNKSMKTKVQTKLENKEGKKITKRIERCQIIGQGRDEKHFFF